MARVAVSKHPFIYIAAIRRSGSTILSEMLTDPPRSFIFREPRLARGVFDIKPGDAERMAELGIDLHKFRRCWVCPVRKGRAMRGFRRKLYPSLLEHFDQVGVKEISHSRWRRYDKSFPGMRIVALARDPRDVYLSLLDRAGKGTETAQDVAAPAAAAEAINRQLAHQREMVEQRGALKVTYEQLCTDPNAFARIRDFCQSPLDQPGVPGQFNASNVARADEAALHAGRLTPSRVDRWRNEPDPQRRAAADEVLHLTRDFADYWGYA
jgi:hypothetical protein